MQATVSAFEPSSASGRVLLDDGIELRFTAEALTGSGLRLLRTGQRVRLELGGPADDPQIERLQIITLT